MLAIVSGRMLWESFRPDRSQGKEVDITRGLLLVTLSIATSIDALAIGPSFAFLNVNIALASSIIGTVAFVVTILGFKLDRKASKLIGKRAEAIGGIILLAIGLRILLGHALRLWPQSTPRLSSCAHRVEPEGHMTEDISPLKSLGGLPYALRLP
jgi:putative Mn2+ efflux pump MntP